MNQNFLNKTKDKNKIKLLKKKKQTGPLRDPKIGMERMLLLFLLLLLLGSVVANQPPRFELLDGSSGSEIVLKLKEGKEATPIGSVIYRIRASDADGDALQFALLGQAANELLSVRPVPDGSGSGAITNEADLILIKELDREVSPIC